ncbi:MAG: alkaline phosphatase family protein, partial [Bacteroidia bacterium]|nr:alkaline phosphatase family protein [Bacteroidia bacterium]MDW8157977.1 alkaline phosphatase family protein [Bacteroidia bacterium]
TQTWQAPKLVVGIVVDQMRVDFLYRYQNRFGEGGLKKLLKQGVECRSAKFNYVPTYTGPGHTSIFTGSIPAITGIIGNEWFERKKKSLVYCVADETVRGIGTEGKAGKMSPHNLLVPTIGDELKLATNQKSKVIGVCLKDRGAILSAGHSADAAYWFDGESGRWISSSYYLEKLPKWVEEFNEKKLADEYLNQNWELLFEKSTYTQSTEDDMFFEAGLPPSGSRTFPHPVPKIKENNYELIKFLPAGLELTTQFAIAAIQNEDLGKDAIPDLLTISYSTTDYIGHQFGSHSLESEDIYLRLDKELEKLFNFLDKQIGFPNYLVFLTADHGVVSVPNYLKSKKIPAGVYTQQQLQDSITAIFGKYWPNEPILEYYCNQQIYLNEEYCQAQKIKIEEIYSILRKELLKIEGIAEVVPLGTFHVSLPSFLLEKIINGYNPKRSGNFYILLQPSWIEGGLKGTTHGAPYNYDIHVPLLFMGWKLPKGLKINTTIAITDITPTLCNWLSILPPAGVIGKIINEIPIQP